MVKNSKTFEVTGIVESAEYKASSTSGLMLSIGLKVHLSKTFFQKVWDNLMIDDSSISAIWYGRKKAKELAVACGLEKIPEVDEVSKLVGNEVVVRLAVDEDGEIKIYGYKPAIDESKPVGTELPF